MSKKFKIKRILGLNIAIIVFLSLYHCKSPTKPKDELEGYVKVNRLDTLKTIPDKFYFEVYLSVIQSSTDWESGPTILFPKNSVWEYRAKTESPGDTKLMIYSEGNEKILSNHGDNNTTYVIGFRNYSYSLSINNNGSNKVTVDCIFTKSTISYSQAEIKM